MRIRRRAKMLDKERIYGYAKAYLESVADLLKDKAESDRNIGNTRLLQMSLNQYEDDLSELKQIMEDRDYE